MKFSKELAQRFKQEMIDSENSLKLLQTAIHFTQNPYYQSCKEQLDHLYEKKAV